jgi:hypothetical protein
VILLLTGCDTLGRVHRLGGWHPNAQLCHSSGTCGVHMCAVMPWAWVSWWLPVKCTCGVSLTSRPFAFGFSVTTYTHVYLLLEEPFWGWAVAVGVLAYLPLSLFVFVVQTCAGTLAQTQHVAQVPVSLSGLDMCQRTVLARCRIILQRIGVLGTVTCAPSLLLYSSLSIKYWSYVDW